MNPLQDRIEAAVSAALAEHAFSRPGDSQLGLAARDAVRGVLTAAGVRNARVITREEAGVLCVDIRMPPGAPRIERVRVRMR